MNPQQPSGQPGAAAAQPPAQNQQQVQGPSFGISGGGRVSFGAGDMSPTALFSGVVSGKGLPAPRKLGLIMLAVGIAFAAGNFALIYVLHLYYPYLLGLAPLFMFGGLFMAATDEPKVRADGTNAPMWTRAALGGLMLLGLAIGAYLCFAVSWG